jgi:hypothetical protein
MAASVGVILLVVAALVSAMAWLGFPSLAADKVQWVAPGARADPYSATDYYVALSMLGLAVSALFHVLNRVASHWKRQ